MNAELKAHSVPASRQQSELGGISVVIVVWNAQEYVLECLDSLQKHCSDVYTEVIVVDNCSTDGTPEMVTERFPEFKLIRNPENLGFAKANNIGIAASSGDFVCLVNSDVKFIDDCISPMLNYLLLNPGVAMIGPKMLSADGEVRRSTMRFPTPWSGFCRALGLDKLFKGSRLFGGFMMSDFDHQTTMPVEVLNGWFVIARRDAIQRVGTLDPQFFMYGEDIDWCYRFRKDGNTIVFFGGSAAIHYGGASSSNAPIRFSRELSYANLQLWKKHRGWIGATAFLLIIGIHHSVRLLGWAFTYLCRPSHRSNALFKIERSIAVLRWLIGAKNRTSTELAQPSARP
jgi:GT2 family glycosyltransferase